MSVGTSARVGRAETGIVERLTTMLVLGMLEAQFQFGRVRDRLLGLTSVKLYRHGGREAIEAHVDAKYAHDTATIRGRVARESRIWEIMGIAIAIVLTLFVVGILVANLPDTGSTEFDNATTNATTDIAENLELAPLVVLIIIVVLIVFYVMRMRRSV
jgi:hypothetical protein